MPCAGCHPGSRCYLACVVNVSMLICSSWEGCKAKVSFSSVLMEFAARGLRMWLAGMRSQFWRDCASFMIGISSAFVFAHAAHVACRILVPWPGIEPVTPALGACSLNHWTTREIPDHSFLSAVPHVSSIFPFLNDAAHSTWYLLHSGLYLPVSI